MVSSNIMANPTRASAAESRTSSPTTKTIKMANNRTGLVFKNKKGRKGGSDFVIDQDDYRVMVKLLGSIQKQARETDYPGSKTPMWRTASLRHLRDHCDETMFIQKMVKYRPYIAHGENGNESYDNGGRVRILEIPSGLLRLPDFIPEMDAVEVLVLKCSILSIEGLSSWIGKMPNLVGLEIDTVSPLFNLNTFPDEAGKLIQLKTLSVKTIYRIESPLPSSLWKLTNLTTLKLDVNHKTDFHVPDAIGNLTNLENIEFIGRGLLSIPSSIGNLKKLKTLKCDETWRLCSLPEELGELVHLEELTLRRTSISSSFSWMGKLENLIMFDFHNQNLTKFPVEMGSLKSLEELLIGDAGMGGTKIPSIPTWIGNFKHLRKLFLHDLREVESLPSEIGDLVMLEFIGINFTGIVCLPCSIGRLTNLKEIQLLMNQKLQSLSQGIYELTQLEKLCIMNSEVLEDGDQVIQQLLKKCTSLVDLTMARCGINKIDHVLEFPRKLEKLKLNGNPILGTLKWSQQLSKSCHYLVILDLEGCGISDIDPVLKVPRNLQRLCLKRNPILRGGMGSLPNKNLFDLVAKSQVLGSLSTFDDEPQKTPEYEKLIYQLGVNRARYRLRSGSREVKTVDTIPPALWAFIISNARAAFHKYRASDPRDIAWMEEGTGKEEEDEEDAKYSMLTEFGGANCIFSCQRK